MEAYFDHKQKELITHWHELSSCSKDNYMTFISEWIAFYAICYNQFNNEAIVLRANIDRAKSKIDKIA